MKKYCECGHIKDDHSPVEEIGLKCFATTEDDAFENWEFCYCKDFRQGKRPHARSARGR